MYSYEIGNRTVQLYIKLGERITATICQLGQALAVEHTEVARHNLHQALEH